MRPDVASHLIRLGGLSPVGGDTFQPLGDDELHALQHDFGGRFPEDYRAFVNQFGRGGFNEIVGRELNDDFAAHVCCFYGGGRDSDDVYNIKWAMSVYEGRMPETVVPIAECAEEGEICLGVKGAEYGKVYFWDRDTEWKTQSEYCQEKGLTTRQEIQFQNMTMLDNTFSEFLLHLKRL